MSVSYDAYSHRHQIERLIRKNPQIRSIETRYFPANYVKVINELLPNVENVTVSTLNYSGSELIFTHVKKFDLNEDQPETIGSLSFSQLETMKMVYKASLHNVWLDFFRKHQNISKLYLRQREYVNEFRVPLVDITAQLHNLTEVTILVQHHLNIEVVNQFFENHQQLGKLVYMKNNFQTAEQERLRERFQREWHIEYQQIKLEHESNSFCSGLIFEKINQQDF